jgi:hypothetical protein
MMLLPDKETDLFSIDFHQMIVQDRGKVLAGYSALVLVGVDKNGSCPRCWNHLVGNPTALKLLKFGTDLQ